MKERHFDFTFFCLIILFLLVKFTMLLFSNFLRYHGDYYELYSGMIAKIITENKILNPAYFIKLPECYGGRIVTGFITAPFFIVFGKTLFTLRMVTLLFSFSSFILIYIFLKKFFNKRIATIAGVLYIFPPIFFFIYSTTHHSSHADIIFFNITAIYLFYKIFFGNCKKIGLFILFGLVSGAGTFFLPSHFIVVLELLLLWFIFDKRLFLKRNFYLFAAFFMIGFSPWFIAYHAQSNLIHGKPLEFLWILQIGRNASHFMERLFDYVIYLYKSFFLADASDKIYIPRVNAKLYYPYYSIFLVSYVFCLWKHRYSFKKLLLSFKEKLEPNVINPSIPLLIFPIFLLLAFTFTTGAYSSKVAARYWLPAYPFIFIIIAFFLDYLWTKGARIMSIIFIMFLTGTFLCSAISSLECHNILHLFKAKGYGYHLYMRLFPMGKPKNMESFLNEIKHMKKAYKQEIYFGLGYLNAKDPIIFKMPIEGAEKEYLPFFYISLGYHRNFPIERFEDNNFNNEQEIFYFIGLGPFFDKIAFDNCLTKKLPEASLHKIHMLFGFNLFLEGKTDLAINAFDEKYVGDIYRGMGRCYGFISLIPPDYKYAQCLMTTIESMDRMYWKRHSDEWRKEDIFIGNLSERWKEYFYKGAAEGEAAMTKLLQVCE